MANSASAKKRIKQNDRNHSRNKARKSLLKTQTRKFLDALQSGDVATAREMFPRLQRKIDQVAAKGTLHRNTASRRKSLLATQLQAAMAGAKG